MKITTPNLLFFGWYLLSVALLSLWIMTSGSEPIIRIFESDENQDIFILICLLFYIWVRPRNVIKMNQGLWTKPLSTIRFSDFTPEVFLTTVKWILVILIFIFLMSTIDTDKLNRISNNPYFKPSFWALIIVINTEMYLKWWRENLYNK